jgi:hypothetical protein
MKIIVAVLIMDVQMIAVLMKLATIIALVELSLKK